jgi:zinc finger-containing ubiquitin peptidase 1
METQHPEGGESPFIVKDDASIAAILSMGRGGEEDPDFACCPIDRCGEVILLTELDSHIEMHEVESQDMDQDAVSSSKEYEMGDAEQTSFDTKISRELRNLQAQAPSAENGLSERQENAKAAWKDILKMPQVPPKPLPSPKGKSKGPLRRLGVGVSRIVTL